jgi:hypothetical protein
MCIKYQPIWSPSQGSKWVTNPFLAIHKKTVQFQGKLFTSRFLQAAVAGSILGIYFLRKFRSTVAPDSVAEPKLFVSATICLGPSSGFGSDLLKVSAPEPAKT